MRRRSARAGFAVLALAAASVVLAAGPAAAAPTVTVEPSGPLSSGATVTVTAQGFAPAVNVVVAECRPDGSGTVVGPQQCAEATTGSSVVVVADKDGAVRAQLKVTVGDIRSGVSCTGSECVIAAVATAAGNVSAVAPITLTGPGTALPAASATPTPSASSTAAATTAPSASPTATTSATATPEPSTSQPAPVGTPNTPAPNSGTPPKSALPKTGPDDAGRSLVLGLVALQAGLMIAVRTRRSRGTGRHLG